MFSSYWRRLFLFLFFLFPFFIVRGLTIEKVVFRGNKKIKSRILSQTIISQKGKEFSEEMLEADIKSLSEFYREEGFFSSQVSGKSKEGKKGRIIYFQIEEGIRCKVDSIIFIGRKDKGIMKLLSQKSFRFYSANNLKKFKEVLQEYYLNLGYYYVDLNIETTLINTEQMNLIVNVEEGPLTYLKEIKFLGLRRVRFKDALRTTELKRGERYSRKRLYEAARKLYGTNLFANIYFKVIPISPLSGNELEREKKTESLEVRFDCQELKEKIFEFGLGYASPPGRTYHSISWQHLNFFHKVHNLKILFEINPDWKGSYSLISRGFYRIPYVSWTKINFFFQPYLILDVDKSKKRKIWELGEEAGFYYDLTENFQSHLFSKYRKFWGEDDSLRMITNSINLKFLYDTRDDFFSPNSGIYSFSLMEYAGKFLGGTCDFYRFSQEIRVFFLLLFTQALRLSIGSTIPYGRTKAIPDYEKFYLGGMTTLRAYDEKSLAGNKFFLLNWEGRFPIYKILGGVIFVDIGSISLNNEEIAYDVGIGLRVTSPVGPLRIDYAVAPKKFEGRNWWKINFGLGNVF